MVVQRVTKSSDHCKDVRSLKAETDLKWFVKIKRFALTVLLGLSGEASEMKDENIAKVMRVKWHRSKPIMLNAKLQSSDESEAAPKFTFIM